MKSPKDALSNLRSAIQEQAESLIQELVQQLSLIDPKLNKVFRQALAKDDPLALLPSLKKALEKSHQTSAQKEFILLRISENLYLLKINALERVIAGLNAGFDAVAARRSELEAVVFPPGSPREGLA